MFCSGKNKKGDNCRIKLKTGEYCRYHRVEDPKVSKKPEMPKIPKTLTKSKVLGDGFCFWRSIAYCVNRNQDEYRKYMKICYNNKKEDEIISYSWVETGEIPMIAKYLQRDITLYYYYQNNLIKNIYRKDGKNIDNEVVTKFGVSKDNDEINIYYFSHHYDPLV